MCMIPMSSVYIIRLASRYRKIDPRGAMSAPPWPFFVCFKSYMYVTKDPRTHIELLYFLMTQCLLHATYELFSSATMSLS